MKSVTFFIFFYLMISGQAGRYDDSVRTGSFKQAKMFCIDPLSNIIVYDEHTQVLLKLSAGGDTLGVYGGYGWSHYTFDRPMDVISRNSLDIYIADYGNHRIVHLDKNLNYISSLGSSEVSTGDDFIFRYPRSIALDRFGKLYVIDGENNRIVKLDDKNHLERSFGGFDAGSGRLVKPTKVRISGDDLVLVQDGNRIIAFDLLGNYHHTIGKGYFKKLESFSVEKKNIFAIDDTSLIIMKTDGKIISVTSIILPSDDFINSFYIDIDVSNGVPYLLSRKYIVRYDTDSIIVH